MAALVEGKQYGLSSSGSGSGNKTVVHFKLTDSALRTIEEFSKLKDGLGEKPTIKFVGNHGLIKIPGKKSSDNEGTRSFQFALSSIQGDPNGSFDCIQQTSLRCGSSQLNSLGCMTHRVVVHATDDVYRTTREKMTLAEEENKKVCTKEIKPSGPYIGRKLKKVIRNGNSLKTPLSKHSAISVRPHHHSSVVNSSSALHLKHHHRQQRPPPPLPPPSSHSPNTGINSSHVITSSLSGGHKRSAMMEMPYRDRVIHLLALRSYNKAELLVRLKKDGIHEKDKDSLSRLLDEVASFSSRDNTYILSPNAYSEVRLDWPFYTETDKKTVKKRLQMENRSASASPDCSPASNISTGSPLTSQLLHCVQKRTADGACEPTPLPKKSKVIQNEKPKKDDNNHINGISKSHDVNTSGYHRSKVKEDDNLISVSSSSDNPDYLSKYTVIRGNDQRQQYKDDFNNEYSEYRQLYGSVQKVSKRFRDLQQQFHCKEKDTEEYNNLKKKILKEYETQKSDSQYLVKKKRFEYLHSKLGHIKKLILEYDQHQLSSLK